MKELSSLTWFQVATIESNFLVKPQGCTAQTWSSGSTLNWNLVRLSRNTSTLSGSFPYAYYYDDGPKYPCCSGGTWVYVLDTGITKCNTDFEGRATNGANMNPSWPDGDTCGHGTHVAGIVVGKEYGAMKRAHAIGVKVMGGATGAACTGALDGVMAGIQWAFQNATDEKRLSCSVINMSLGTFVKHLCK